MMSVIRALCSPSERQRDSSCGEWVQVLGDESFHFCVNS